MDFSRIGLKVEMALCAFLSTAVQISVHSFIGITLNADVPYTTEEEEETSTDTLWRLLVVSHLI